MELHFSDNFEFELSQSCEIIFPEYINKLNDDEVCRQEEPSKIIVAAGADPADGKILMLTADFKVYVFNARKFCIPDGPAEPKDGGKKIFLKNVNERWPTPVDGFFVESVWILKNSEPALKNAVLQTNMYYK